MTVPVLLLLLALGSVASWALTSSVRRYALNAGLLDEPNARSSHSRPTPRGGGIAIVFSFLALVGVLAAGAVIDRGLGAALIGSGAVVAALGFLDDRRHLPARWRFVGHLVAAAWILFCLGPLPAVPLLGVTTELGVGATLLAGLYLVWSINLFNFMDGIDAIASLEAIAMGLGGALIWWLADAQGGWFVAVAFAACVSGFLFWNFPPARIFMGDAGSGFLGCMIATMALWSSRTEPHLFWAWFILGGAFMADATTTLLRRALRGERISEAHRSHAYQFAARKHGSHKRVAIAYLLITTGWLLPLAVLVATRRLDGIVGVVIAYLPLVVLAFRYKAGDRAAQEVRG